MPARLHTWHTEQRAKVVRSSRRQPSSLYLYSLLTSACAEPLQRWTSMDARRQVCAVNCSAGTVIYAGLQVALPGHTSTLACRLPKLRCVQNFEVFHRDPEPTLARPQRLLLLLPPLPLMLYPVAHGPCPQAHAPVPAADGYIHKYSNYEFALTVRR